MRSGTTIVLGNRGFIGQALCRYLESSGAEVQGLSSEQVDLRRPEGVAALSEALTPDTTVIVCSGIAPPGGNTLDGLADNLLMATNLARALEAHPPRKCVYLSSDAVYPLGDAPVTEESALELSSYYAIGKYTTETVLQTVAAAKGFPLLLLRPTGVYGPGDTHGSYGPNRFVRQVVQDGSVRLFGQGEETRDHIYVDDLVRITAALAASDATGVLNLATGSSRTFGSVVDDLRAIVPDAFEVVNAPRGGAVTHRAFDVARLRMALPECAFTPFETGLRATYMAARSAQ
jgi:UDP-glucose 4-epimerase